MSLRERKKRNLSLSDLQRCIKEKIINHWSFLLRVLLRHFLLTFETNNPCYCCSSYVPSNGTAVHSLFSVRYSPRKLFCHIVFIFSHLHKAYQIKVWSSDTRMLSWRVEI